MDLSNRNTSGRGGGNNTTLVWIILAALAIIAGGFLIGTLTPQVMPREASTQARQVDELFRFLLTLAGIVFLLVQGVLAFSVIRFRARKGDTGDGPAIHGNTTLEFVWTAIPALTVLAITIYSYQVFTTTRAPQPNEQTVGVVAARFAWTFTYDVTPDQFPADVDVAQLDPAVQADIEQDGHIQIISPQLYTFVNQPMVTQMQTQDVIHSFWVPEMRIKQDLLPGRTTEIRFTPTTEGFHRVVCAELCGSGHGFMAGSIVQERDEQVMQGAWVYVYPDEDMYRSQFLEPEMMRILFPPEDPAARGQQILASGKYPCATCHTLSTVDGWVGNIGPSLDGVGSRTQRLDATGLPTMEAYLHDAIRNPQHYLVPGFGPLMPQFNPSPDQPNFMPEPDLDAIVAFLLMQTGP